MKIKKKLSIGLLALVLTGCAAPKPPPEPSGTPFPINPADLKNEAGNAVKKK
ncbi:hypothetical protein JHL22_10325 [Advenella sp. WQ 585]|uniref:Conjugal transfer protein n=1 Tax=Advenella mandrilli TaxID=2800330 RepID=A0ABS1EG83_9BURK|nr:hypothetical protein [Advenella mandrilli]MBK1781615.1 hypothetical protein [Advenella mandrilli]